MNNQKYKVYTFYRFCKIENIKNIKQQFDMYLKKKYLKGTILISSEGINASISGKIEELDKVIMITKKLLNVRKLTLKKNDIDFLPFNRMKVRLKKEIVSLGKGKINTNKSKMYIHPSKWDELLENSDIKLIDVRNIYEIGIGNFKGSINPNTLNFREFPEKFQNLKIEKDQKIAMYCTGGIRCEKASAYLSNKGYKNLYQLEGGILNYLEYKKNQEKIPNWKGECFVFDNRVTVNKSLETGNYTQCFGCRHPLTISEKKLKSYIEGVCCKYCFKLRSKHQLNRSRSRQKQINLANKRGQDHVFKNYY